uniref:Uncharacterized protein n=2 Tax=Meloidogyne TaxID=189290 RepID=A0A915LW66_MELJA
MNRRASRSPSTASMESGPYEELWIASSRRELIGTARFLIGDEKKPRWVEHVYKAESEEAVDVLKRFRCVEYRLPCSQRMKVRSVKDLHQILVTAGEHSHELSDWHLACNALHLKGSKERTRSEPPSAGRNPYIDPRGIKYGVTTPDTYRE